MNKLLKITLIFILIMPTLSNLSSIIVDAATDLEPGTYTIKNILAHDLGQHPGPQLVSEILEYVDSGGSMPNLTGWSAYDMVCVNGQWFKDQEVNTSDSGRDKNYPVSEYHSEIIQSLKEDGYTTEKAEQIYQAALATGLSLKYQDGSKVSIYTGGEKKWYPCKAEERGAYYNNLDFKLTLTFEVDEEGLCPTTGQPLPCPPEPDKEKPVGKCELVITVTDGSSMDKSKTTAPLLAQFTQQQVNLM